MYDGILLIDKPAGITSYDVIRDLKKKLPKGQKIGHAGTLDPFATGLLIILLGKATKKFDEIQKMPKVYEVEMEFGYETDTQDNTGTVINRTEDLAKVSETQMARSLLKFTGQILQTPPKFSAKKVSGKSAYKLARAGTEFELKPVSVAIHEIEVTGYDWPKVKLRVKCSSGTYIRTLVSDIGKDLGTFATATELKRISIGDYSLQNVHTPARLSQISSLTIPSLLIPI